MPTTDNITGASPINNNSYYEDEFERDISDLDEEFKKAKVTRKNIMQDMNNFIGQ